MKARVHVTLKRGVLDPQGEAVRHALGSLGFDGVEDVRMGKVIELDLMTEAQHSALPEDEEVTAADRLIIDSPTETGLIVLKALAPEPGLMPQAQTSLAASSCPCWARATCW